MLANITHHPLLVNPILPFCNFLYPTFIEMAPHSLLIIGSSGITGQALITKLLKTDPSLSITATFYSSAPSHLVCSRQVHYIPFDCNNFDLIDLPFSIHSFDQIILLSNIRHLPNLINSIYLSKTPILPRIVLIGTTGVFSSYESYSGVYKNL